MPVDLDKQRGLRRESLPSAELPRRDIPVRLRLAALLMRAVFICILVVITTRVSLPQSERIWTVYETPGDLVRLALGSIVCVWMIFHLFMIPKDPEAYRIWLYFGLAAIPFTLLCLIAVW